MHSERNVTSLSIDFFLECTSVESTLYKHWVDLVHLLSENNFFHGRNKVGLIVSQHCTNVGNQQSWAVSNFSLEHSSNVELRTIFSAIESSTFALKVGYYASKICKMYKIMHSAECMKYATFCACRERSRKVDYDTSAGSWWFRKSLRGECCNSDEWGTTNSHVYHILFFATLYRKFALTASKSVRKK